MDYNSIIKNYSEEKKDSVVRYAILNKESMKNNTYHNKALDLFFKMWKEHFPNNPQQKSCRGCRQAVCKFFNNVADYISSERLKVVETANAPNPKRTRKEIREVIKVVKKKAKKKHKTITGALSPTGTSK